MSTALFRLGWTTALADAFAPFAAQGLFPARVALEHTHIYRVIGESGESLARVRVRISPPSGIGWPSTRQSVLVTAESSPSSRGAADSPAVRRATRPKNR